MLAVIWKLNAVPTVPFALVALVMTGRAGRTRIVNLDEPAPPAFEADRFTIKLPATVGVPEICPLVAFRLNPVGRPVAL